MLLDKSMCISLLQLKCIHSNIFCSPIFSSTKVDQDCPKLTKVYTFHKKRPKSNEFLNYQKCLESTRFSMVDQCRTNLVKVEQNLPGSAEVGQS